jgi:hypothetical protein
MGAALDIETLLCLTPPSPLLGPLDIVIPLHYTAFKENTKLQQDLQAHGNPSQLMRLTIAAVPNGSQLFWCVAAAGCAGACSSRGDCRRIADTGSCRSASDW